MDRASCCCMAAQGALLLPEPPLAPPDGKPPMPPMGTPGNMGRPVMEEAVELSQLQLLDCTFLVLASSFLTFCLAFSALAFSCIFLLSIWFLAFIFSAASLSLSSRFYCCTTVHLEGFLACFFAFAITFLALAAAFLVLLEPLDFLALAH